MGDDLRKLDVIARSEATLRYRSGQALQSPANFREIAKLPEPALSPVEGVARNDGIKSLLISLAQARDLGDVATLLARMTDEQLSKTLRVATSWKKILERNGLGDRVAPLDEARLSATDRAFLALAGLARSERDVGKVVSRFKPDGNGVSVPNPAVLIGSVGSVGFRTSPLQVLR